MAFLSTCYFRIPVFFALFSLIHLQISSPLWAAEENNSDVTKEVPYGGHSWDNSSRKEAASSSNTQSAQNEEVIKSEGLRQSTPDESQEELGIGKFSNAGVEWITVILNHFVIIALGATLAFMLVVCHVKALKVPSITTLTLVTAAWIGAFVVFAVSYVVLTKKMAEEFKYNKNDDKDKQLAAIQAMRDNANKLYMLYIAQTVVYAALVAGIAGVLAVTTAELLLYLQSSFNMRVTAAVAVKTALGTFIAADKARILACTLAPEAAAATEPIVGGITTTETATVAETETPGPTETGIPGVVSVEDLKKCSTITTANVALKKEITALNIAYASAVGKSKAAADLACGATLVGCAAQADHLKCVAASAAMEAPMTALILNMDYLSISCAKFSGIRTMTFLDCFTEMSLASTSKKNSNNYLTACSSSFSNKSLTNFFLSSLLEPVWAVESAPATTLPATTPTPESSMISTDPNGLAVGVLGGIVDAVAIAAIAGLVYYFKKKIGTSWIHPKWRILMLTVVLAAATVLEGLQVATVFKIKKRVEDFDDLIKKIKKLKADNVAGTTATSGTPVPDAYATVGTDETDTIDTGERDGVNLGRDGAFALKDGGYSLSEAEIDSANIDYLNGKSCIAQGSRNSFGQFDANCDCLKTKSCKSYDVESSNDSLSKLGGMQGAVSAANNGFSNMAKALSGGRPSDALKVAKDGNFRNALKRLGNYKKQLQDKLEAQKAKDKNVPKFNYGMNDPEVQAVLSDIKKAAGSKAPAMSLSGTGGTGSMLGPLSSGIMGGRGAGDSDDNLGAGGSKGVGEDTYGTNGKGGGEKDDSASPFDSFSDPIDNNMLDDGLAKGKESGETMLETTVTTVNTDTGASVFELLSVRYRKVVHGEMIGVENK